ncbi:hypothetical protein [Flammeovirga agarivorans]|uniref:Uncharacterized protein n=1 Tax=Flammeovirga agarivorans TaxID=2726742 RepID=A0A7X8XZL3_9BACT|nr:hypothetical protein [Flammeovirga agarivorans]NLR95090.1 hypothetical protein [Flammeovirga agarivorans]
MQYSEPEILLSQESPNCPIKAIVEQDDRVVYFYLWSQDNSKYNVKSCWVRNLKEAPEKLNSVEMERGLPPMQPKQFCKYPLGEGKLNKSDLQILWNEEGDSAILLEKGRILSIIPSWSGDKGFHGYAKNCLDNSSLAWELTTENTYIKRASKAV